MVQERLEQVERRLAAILAADVAGYSRLMQHDEEATHTKLTALLREIIDPAIIAHSGRIVKNTGDGFLAVFSSAVAAVRAAVQFQARIKELTTPDVEKGRIAFRVGINVSDVIVERHYIFGDGVNIAARLEGIAKPGGVCISSSAYEHVRGKLNVTFADLGEQSLKNIDRPVRAYALVDGVARHDSPAAPASVSPPRVSIVVLPFSNLSDDPNQEYFVDGVTESLTTLVTHRALVCDRSTYGFCIQGQIDSSQTDRSRIECSLRVRRLCAAKRQPSARKCSTGRNANGHASMGGPS